MMTCAQYNRLDVSIYASDREVIAAAHRMLTPAARRAANVRAIRHEFLRGALVKHREARELAQASQL